MKETSRDILKAWQFRAVRFLHDPSASPSELESCAIALRRDAPKMAKQCDDEAAKRMGKWRVKKPTSS